MARTRVRTARLASLVALSAALPLLAGCGEDKPASGTDTKGAGGRPVVVATTDRKSVV